jgi:hypothetical protein
MNTKKVKDDFDQMFDGQSFTLDEGQDLMLACCDCGSTHYIKIKVLGTVKGKRQIKFIMTKDEVETINQRNDIEDHYENGFKVKVSKIKYSKNRYC